MIKTEKFEKEGIEFIIEINDSGEKTLSIKGINVNLNFNGVRLATIEEKVNLCKVYDFIQKFKYDNEEISTKKDGISKDIGLCIKGFDFHSHWVEEPNKDVKCLNLNDFVPDYKLIIEGLSDLDNSISSQFLSPKYYEDEYNDFMSKLKKLGIFVEENAGNEYDVLMTFSLPANKLDDDKFFEQFMGLYCDYKNKYNDELDVLYGG